MALNQNMSFHRACTLVYAHCPDPYAKSYAYAALNMTDADEQHIQALYILNNIRSWRGPMATEVRGVFKKFTSR